jgi:hypothetical protein
MGNSLHSSSSPGTQAKARAEKRRRELETCGVLLPPSFLVTDSLSLQDRLPQQQPSLYQNFEAQDLSNRILLDLMRPGLWIAAAADPMHHSARVLASIPLESMSKSTKEDMTGKNNNSNDNISSLLLLERAGTTSALQLRIGSSFAPTLSAGYTHPTNNPLTLFAHMNPQNGHGWVGSHLEYTLREKRDNRVKEYEQAQDKNLYLTLGTFVQGSLTSLSQRSISSACPFHTSPVIADQVLAYGGFQFLGSTTAFETKVPLHPHGPDLTQASTRTYFHMTLGGDEDSGPPLQISLSKTPTRQSLALSQTIAWDRYQLNPLEDRAPKIRNSLAWTVRMEQPTTSNRMALTSTSSSTPDLSVGAAWQINRAFGLKAVLTSHDGLTTALVFKRWMQPRLACSLIVQPTTGSLVGIALELETGKLGQAAYVADGGRSSNSKDVPETRTTVPMM